MSNHPSPPINPIECKSVYHYRKVKIVALCVFVAVALLRWKVLVGSSTSVVLDFEAGSDAGLD